MTKKAGVFSAFGILLGCFAVIVNSCSLPSSRYYLVQDGDTLEGIARQYAIEPMDLQRYNPSQAVSPGKKFYIPFEKTAPRPTRLPAMKKVASSYEDQGDKKEFRRYGLQWPVKRGQNVSSAFGVRGYRFHEGIDISAQRHTRVHASQAGQVVYADNRIRGYGRMVIVDHGNRVRTVYAHLQKISVKKGDWVRRAQLVGTVGSSGRSSGPHLHFEVRNGTKPHNPLYYLPIDSPRLSEAKR